MTSNTLADRIEGAEEPSRELDAEIAADVSGDPAAWVVTENPDSIFTHNPGWFCTGDDKSHEAPAYSASIDAAMTLVPEGWGWKVRKWAGGGAAAGCYPPEGSCAWINAATPALALCAASLRARATTGRDG